MALNEQQQFNELIKKSKNILICFPAQNEIVFDRGVVGDALASALVLFEYLKEEDKKIEIVCAGFKIFQEYGFLHNIDVIKSKLVNLKQFVIALDLQNKKVDEFFYDVEKNKLKIYIMPSEGEFDKKDINIENSDYRFDCIITLNTPDLESLGKLYFDNREFFFNTPIINIDANLNNENYGQLNLVKPTKTSSAEILWDLIDEEVISEQMANALLTGMISATKSFKTSNVTPQTLQIASKLINLGANREVVVSNLYRTKTLTILKLWGRVLARLQQIPEIKLVWSSLPYSDFIKSGASIENIAGVVEELIANSPQAEIILLLFEKADRSIGGQLYTTPNIDSKYLLNNYDVSGTKNFVTFNIVGQKMLEVEEKMISDIRQKLIK